MMMLGLCLVLELRQKSNQLPLHEAGSPRASVCIQILVIFMIMSMPIIVNYKAKILNNNSLFPVMCQFSLNPNLFQNKVFKSKNKNGNIFAGPQDHQEEPIRNWTSMLKKIN